MMLPGLAGPTEFLAMAPAPGREVSPPLTSHMMTREWPVDPAPAITAPSQAPYGGRKYGAVVSRPTLQTVRSVFRSWLEVAPARLPDRSLWSQPWAARRCPSRTVRRTRWGKRIIRSPGQKKVALAPCLRRTVSILLHASG